LLGKGTTGRAFAGLDTMWLSGSNAFTQQWRTSYHFNTAAGPDVFFDLFSAQLNAMLHPNYTDEEIRREVRNFGVTENPDGTLRLEEKGSVYNEMVSSTTNRYRVLYRAADQLVYGPTHPLSVNSGGEPSGIRTMQPADIRSFHKANYYLGNMGTIVTFPKNVPIAELLTRVDAILDRVEPDGTKRAATIATPLPAPAGAASATIRIDEYPHRNEQQPSPVMFIWPANRTLVPEEQLLLELFGDNFSSDTTTNLYKLFVDSKTRVMDTSATAVFSQIDRDLGSPVRFALDNVAPVNITNEKLIAIRQKIVDELNRVASFPDGSPELKEFNTRMQSRVVELERDLAKFTNTPPSFGARNTGSSWMDHLLLLEKTPDFRKSVTLEPQMAFVRKQITSDKNVWRDFLTKWKLTGVVPYVSAAKPSPSMLQREEQERVARAAAEAARLAKSYGIADEQEAIKRYRTDYDAESARIEEEAKKITPPQFVKTPPMTLDDVLKFDSRSVEGVPLVVSTFDNMTSATLGLGLRVDGIPREQLRYLSLLPALLTRVGVIENGKPVSYEEMSERLRNEILSLDANYSTNPRTDRVELTIRGAGLGAKEFDRAIDWMSLVLYHPDWRAENLARIRDVVDQAVSNFRNTMQGPEEAWVQNPANSYRMQSDPAYLAADSFLTRAHNALRLRWLLREAADADRDALNAFFTKLAASPDARDVSALSPAAQAIANDMLKDLDLTRNDIPESSLAADWSYLVNALRDDLFTPPAKVLADLENVRRALLRNGNARMYLVTNSEMQKSSAPKIAALVAPLEKAPHARADYGNTRHVDARLLARDSSATKPVYVGLLAPNMKGGVILTSTPGVHFSDFGDREKQLDFLASRLHAGYGAHGIFLKTIGAGLAYSNGLRASVQSGRMGYYAERTPEIPQTVKFVVNELKTAARDPRLGDYAIAQVFAEGRAASTYETRAEGIAADLADNQPPDQVRKFRQSILELRKDPELGNKLFDRKDAVYGRFLPGYNVKGADVADAVFFTIGPDKQQDAWERYVKGADGADTKLYRLYPRDFWMP
ncbi:MAG TPA: hypothetical protein VMU84_13235, partial [Thermoanaerobaculia bacterium]|nr:hypothetical protein [Thermoanaerobaculia bacterium]